MKVLITGGAGFIGCNWAARLIRGGHSVTIFDNLSRTGAQLNLDWLRSQGALTFVHADIRDASALGEAAKGQDAIYHLAGQVAVTTSVAEPREDFEINALGTFNVLEAARASGDAQTVVYASTNKVYGGMETVRVSEGPSRYSYVDLPFGVSESEPLDFHSPYGCSKGAGDQYVRDYSRIYGVPTVVFRQSCIYGPRQFGVEDQGWLAHFMIAVAKNVPITIYGDGKQVRDVLWVDDLLDAYEIALTQPAKVAGQIFNIGGGSDFTLSIWTDVASQLEALAGRKIDVRHGAWRSGDQKIYISDIRKANRLLGWAPTISPGDGLQRLWTWVSQQFAFR
jgi:CDP-paratose 2-epimerase